jgi:SPP1 gp7 family putative phage head morphogenesis protein
MALNANTQIQDKVVDRAAMVRLYEKRVNDKVELTLDGHKVRVDKLIREAKLSDKGLLRLREAIDQDIKSTFKEIYNTNKRSLLDLFTDQASFAYQNIETTMGKIWRTQRPTRRVAEEVVLERPLYKEHTLAAGWAGIGENERKRLEHVIRKGIADGKSVEDIALAVRKGNIHNITRAQSKALVVTSITSVHAQADHAVYKANEKALHGWQYVAKLDSQTTRLCAFRDGTIYPISDTEHLPPAHFNCRSVTVPVFKSWSDIAKLENVAYVRKRNIQKLSKKDLDFYDGLTPMQESYHSWLQRQTPEIQLRHLGDYQKLELFRKGQLNAKAFLNEDGRSLGIRELRKQSDELFTLPNDTRRFAIAKEKLDSMHLGASTPDDFINDTVLTNTLRDYYLLQASELDGTLSLTNYRGALIGTKKAVKRRVLISPPREDQMIFNPLTGRYQDVRLYQPNQAVLSNGLRLVEESDKLLDRDKKFINDFINSLDQRMGANERAVIADNLRIIFGRYRDNKEVWSNFKAVVQGQIKYDVMNISDAIETQIRKDSNVFKRLSQDSYLDTILGPTSLDELHDNFIDNIIAKNKWEDTMAPKLARELREVFDPHIPLKVSSRLSEDEIKQFYLKLAHRLSLADLPDFDQFAVTIGRDLYNLANLTGKRLEWYNLGKSILQSKNASRLYELETFGIQKRRMKSRLSGSYFGPYYDTLGFNIRIVDPRIQEYAKLTRKVELGLRVSVTSKKNRLLFKEGYKTYFIDKGPLGTIDTRIPITSTSSFSDFPEEFLDKDMIDALNWAAKAEYRVDPDFHDFINKLLYFEDDKGRARHFNELNEYRKYIAARGDAYERFKAMQWLRKDNRSFSNHPFIDHRARIYDRGLIGPQSGETFRPFLNTAEEKILGVNGYENLQDQIGAFLGGLSDELEGKYNSLTFTGRQKIAEKWRNDLVTIGNHMLRKKPNDIRAILEHPLVHQIEGEELGKFLRFAIEQAKIDNYLESFDKIKKYSKQNLLNLEKYKTALALEQDASSSGAQIIALTTRNKQLAELSNVIPTNQKKRLYDEIAAATARDPRFVKLNEKLGLTEKDLRKAAKAQNMVECCHV